MVGTLENIEWKCDKDYICVWLSRIYISKQVSTYITKVKHKYYNVVSVLQSNYFFNNKKGYFKEFLFKHVTSFHCNYNLLKEKISK